MTLVIDAGACTNALSHGQMRLAAPSISPVTTEMTMPELAVSKKECEEFARDHLRACVVELLVWKNTRLHPEGALRQLQLQCASWAGDSGAFDAAEAVVVHECLRRISRG